MIDIKTTFDEAVAESKKLKKRPDNDTLLKMYSLYKQATEGDMPADTVKPGMFDFVASAKYNAWKGLAGINADEAMKQYIRLFEKIRILEQ